MLRIALSLLFVVGSLQANAVSSRDAFFTIDESSLRITEVDSGELTKAEIADIVGDCSGDSDADPNAASLGEIINYGKAIWKVIQDNRPVVNVKEAHANALPRGVACWTDLEQWNAPKYKTYEVVYENLMGLQIVNFNFQLFYSYGGNVDGKGQYLANVTVAPMNLEVIWGFKFNANVEVGTVLNMGTKDDPIAGMEMAMKWNLISPLQDSRGQVRYFVEGSGNVQQYD